MMASNATKVTRSDVKGPPDMTIKVGINGFGRIGRCTLSHIATSMRNDIDVVASNASGPLETA